MLYGSKDTLAERLRRRPAIPMGSPRVGSTPTGVVFPDQGGWMTIMADGWSWITVGDSTAELAHLRPQCLRCLLLFCCVRVVPLLLFVALCF